MRISEKKYPALKHLKTGVSRVGLRAEVLPQFKAYAFCHLELFEKFFIEGFEKNKEAYSSNINIVKNSFRSSAKKASVSLAKLIREDMEKENVKLFGTTIYHNYVFFYSWETYSNSEDITATLYVFHEDLLVYAYISDPKKNDSPTFFSFADHKYIEAIFGYCDLGTVDKMERFVFHFMGENVFLYEYFKRYAKVETIEMSKSNRKVTDDKGEKYLNETDYDVTVLDSKWFREIVRDEDFEVRGHFRLQPKKKDGEWTKELIWIEDFIKHGYHRKAKVDIYNNQI